MKTRHRLRTVLLIAAVWIACKDSDRTADAGLKRPEFHSAEAIQGVVVDARTLRPIEGAVVVALWRKIHVIGHRWQGMFRVFETRTSADGEFVIQRWGPRHLDRDYYLDSRDPEIWVLKRGYLVGYFDENGAFDSRGFSVGGSPGLRISKPAPGELPGRNAAGYVRQAHAASLWNGKALPIEPAPSFEAEARSLAVAAPLDYYEPIRVDLRLFWNEWHAARERLGEHRATLEPPLPLVERVRRIPPAN